MTDEPPDDNKIRAALAAAASINLSLRRPRFRELMRFKEQIRDLRRQEASFTTIEKILKKSALNISHETIRVFYWEVIEGKSRKQRRKKNLKRTTKKIHVSAPSGAQDIGRPRIARIEDL